MLVGALSWESAKQGVYSKEIGTRWVVLKEWSLTIGEHFGNANSQLFEHHCSEALLFYIELCGIGGDQRKYARQVSPFRRSSQWPRDKACAWEVTVCLEASRIEKAKPLGESVLTEDLGRENTILCENE